MESSSDRRTSNATRIFYYLENIGIVACILPSQTSPTKQSYL